MVSSKSDRLLPRREAAHYRSEAGAVEVTKDGAYQPIAHIGGGATADVSLAKKVGRRRPATDQGAFGASPSPVATGVSGAFPQSDQPR